MPERYSLQCFMLTHIWRVVWRIFEVGATRFPIPEEMGRRIILKKCVGIVLRCISVRFLDLQPLKIPNFLCSRLRRSRVTLWPTYLEREQKYAFMSPSVWRYVCFEVLRPFHWHFGVFCLWITAQKVKIPFARISKDLEVFRWPYLAGDVYKNKVFASTFVCRFVSWAWGVVVPQEWLW